MEKAACCWAIDSEVLLAMQIVDIVAITQSDMCVCTAVWQELAARSTGCIHHVPQACFVRELAFIATPAPAW
jgi:hypothetical protein